MASNDPTPDFCPYKGLQPYTEEDREYFFGRERDQAIIASNLYGAPLTVLYGASGVGKSSVLLAGVVPHLREDPKVAVVVFRTWQGTSYQTALKQEVLKAVRHAGRGEADVDLSLPFDEFLLACNQSLPFRGRIFFVFDQFEEYFLSPADPRAPDNFDAEFARAVNRREIPASFLLSMRDDGLSKLDRFQGRIPNILSNLLRVEHLKRHDARRAITRPLEIYNDGRPEREQVHIEPELVDALLDKTRPELKGDGRAAPPESPDDWAVETPVLQILLTRLWKEEAGTGCLRLKTFADRGAENIVSGYLREVMDDLTEGEREVASRIMQYLLTPAKTKIAHEPESLAEWSKLDVGSVKSLLARLSAGDDKVLRRVQIAGQPVRFEIFHDVLGTPLYEWREKYVHERETAEAARLAAEAAEKKAREEAMLLQVAQFRALAEEKEKRAAEEAKRAEAERQRAEEKTLSTRRLRWATALLAALFVFAVGAFVFANEQRWQAVEARQKEAQQRVEADAARTEAEEQRKNADEQRLKAEEESARAEREAENARKAQAEAEAKGKEAKRQAEIATQQQRRAVRLAAEADQARLEAVRRRAETERLLELANIRQKAEDTYVVGSKLSFRGKYEDAANKFQAALTSFNELDDVAAQARVLNSLGATYRDIGDTEQARDYYERAESRYRDVGDPDSALQVRVSICGIYENDPDAPGKSLECYKRLLNDFRQQGDNNQVLNLLLTLGQIHGRVGELQQSLETYVLGLRESEKTDAPGSVRANFLRNIADSYNKLGSKPEAVKYYQDALGYYEKEPKSLQVRIDLSRTVAALYREMGDASRADEYEAKARKLEDEQRELRNPRQ